jgi:hypothetical protein
MRTCIINMSRSIIYFWALGPNEGEMCMFQWLYVKKVLHMYKMYIVQDKLKDEIRSVTGTLYLVKRSKVTVISF